MTAEQITAVINLGAAGAVIVVVVYFLRFIAARDKDWQGFMRSLIEARDTPMQQLTETIHELLTEFRSHDTWEHTKLDEMSQAVREAKTRSRSSGKGQA